MNSKLRFLLISLFIFFVAALQASADGDIRVSGVVMSEGEPLPGASVLVKVGSINSIFYFLHKAAEPFNCLEQDNLA